MKNETTQKLSEILSELIETKKDSDYTLSEKKQAGLMGIPYQTFHKYVNGTAECPIGNLVKISKYYNVTTDYLLGLTDNPSINPDIQNACEVTGLSEKSVENLIEVRSYKNDFFNPVDEFIKCSDFDMFVLYIHEYIMSILCTEEEYNDAPDKVRLILRFMESNQLSARDLEVMGIKFRNNNRISLSIEREINNLTRDFLDKLTEKLLKNNPDLHDMRYYGVYDEEL